MANHGVNVSQQATSVSTPVMAESGVPFVVGAAPVQSAASPAAVGVPALCTSWAEAVEKLGYSDDWASYPLCEFAYSHFKLFGCQPVIFCNVLDAADMKEAVAASDVALADHKAKLPIEAIDDSNLVVKAAGGAGDAYVKDTTTGSFLSLRRWPTARPIPLRRSTWPTTRSSPRLWTIPLLLRGWKALSCA